MKELRDIKIDMLTGTQNPIIELFNQITDGIEIVNCDVYNKEGREFIYHKDGEWIFYQDSKNPLSNSMNDKFWCNYERYWSFFECQFELEYWEVQAITKYLVEEALKREVVSPSLSQFFNFPEVEEALKREVVSPSTGFEISGNMVEEALKRGVAAAPRALERCGVREKLEQALKREVAPPSTFSPRENNLIEEAIKRRK